MVFVVQSAQAGNQVSSTFTGAFAGNVTAGSTVLLAVATFSASNVVISSASPTLGGSPVPGAVKLKEIQSAYSGTFTAYAAIWMLPDVAGGSAAFGISVTNGTLNNTQTGLLAWEVSGLGSSPALDQSSASSGAGAGATSGTTGATTQAAELVLGVLIGLDGLTGTPGTPAGYTNLNILGAGSASCGGYRIQSAAGGTYAYANANGGADPWAGAVVTLYAAAPTPAWNRVQSAFHGNGIASTATAATYGAALTAGTKLIALIGGDGGSVVINSVTDGNGNNFTFIGRAFAGSQGAAGLSLWAMDTPAGDAGTTPTITATTSVPIDGSILIQEVSGLLAGNTAAMCDGAAGTGSGSGGGNTTSPAYSSTASREYLVACFSDNAFADTVTDPAAPWAADPANPAGSGVVHAHLSYKDSTNGAETGAVFNYSNAAASYAGLMIAFKLAPVAVPPGGGAPDRHHHRAPAGRPGQHRPGGRGGHR